MTPEDAIAELAESAADSFYRRLTEKCGSPPSPTEVVAYKLGYAEGITDAGRKFQNVLDKTTNRPQGQRRMT